MSKSEGPYQQIALADRNYTDIIRKMSTSKTDQKTSNQNRFLIRKTSVEIIRNLAPYRPATRSDGLPKKTWERVGLLCSWWRCHFLQNAQRWYRKSRIASNEFVETNKFLINEYTSNQRTNFISCECGWRKRFLCTEWASSKVMVSMAWWRMYSVVHRVLCSPKSSAQISIESSEWILYCFISSIADSKLLTKINK